ncbi:hypothetical protein CK203_063558 [Vitis vinifera]|uniref:Reverse transcriptase/retrotransposon-derived protein RNase H-like domain-containing protein n=1 Tax=Vitis vinifera TaxID=29760 RepID=A0A438GC45_VITVI|nr:hypothetical protein CK203_063558 [Vitis vinifera]
MPFGLTNAPATFCNLMNDVLFDYLDAFVRSVSLLRRRSLTWAQDQCRPDQDGQRQGAGYYGVVSPYQSDGVVVLPWLGQLLQKCQMAFEGLKEAISTKPMLRLPDLDLPFEIQTDASDRALGGVLVQEGHPMAQWMHYLLGSIFTVVTDNVANTFFKNPEEAESQTGAMTGVPGRLQI